MQPFPRECAWGEGAVESAGLPVVRDAVRQCEIGAAELPSAGAYRVYAGEEIGEGIYLAVRGTELAERLTIYNKQGQADDTQAQRILSRIYGMCERVYLGGKDWRQTGNAG